MLSPGRAKLTPSWEAVQMRQAEWELFFRTGLPQAYSFAKAAERRGNRRRSEEKNVEQQRTVSG